MKVTLSAARKPSAIPKWPSRVVSVPLRLYRAYPFRLAVAAAAGLGLLIRAYRLGGVPGPLGDEVTAAVTLRHGTALGVGILGAITPIIDGRSVLKALGVSGLTGLRAIPLCFGIITVVVVAVFAAEMFDRRVGVFAAMAVAAMPWAIYYSRVFFPASEYLCLSCLLVLCLRRGITGDRSLRYAVAAAVVAAASIYLYPPAIVSSPLLTLSVLGTGSSFGLKRPLRLLAQVTFGTTLFLIPYGIAHLVAVNTATSGINRVIGSRLLLTSGLSVGQMMVRFAHSYVSYFTPAYLAFHGDPNPAQSVRTFGELGLGLTLLGVVGILLCLASLKQENSRLLLLLLLLYPVADALTLQNAVGNSDVAVIGVLPWALLAGLGTSRIYVWIGDGLQKLAKHGERKRRVCIGVSASVSGLCLILGQVCCFVPEYLGPYVSHFAYHFEFGFSRVEAIVKRAGVAGLPVAVDAGYLRNEMYSYFTSGQLNIRSVYQACTPLPRKYLLYAVPEQVLVVREGWDYGSTPGCVSQRSLIARELRALRAYGRRFVVLAVFKNAPGSPSSATYRTAVILIQSDSCWPRPACGEQIGTNGNGVSRPQLNRAPGYSGCVLCTQNEAALLTQARARIARQVTSSVVGQ